LHTFHYTFARSHIPIHQLAFGCYAATAAPSSTTCLTTSALLQQIGQVSDLHKRRTARGRSLVMIGNDITSYGCAEELNSSPRTVTLLIIIILIKSRCIMDSCHC
jgi:hypothetical protein